MPYFAVKEDGTKLTWVLLNVGQHTHIIEMNYNDSRYIKTFTVRKGSEELWMDARATRLNAEISIAPLLNMSR
jgi:hypothetical protein